MKKRSGRPLPRIPQTPPHEARRRHPLYWGTLAAIVVAAALVRMLAARGELWLDEIWSFRMAGLHSSPLAVFTGIHHDNNHHLNTLYLYFLPESARWMTYRLHTIVAGIGTVLGAALIAHRAGERAALSAALLTAGSFLLILYTSEARGYALAVFFAFLCVPLAERYLATSRTGWAAAFAFAASLGLLSHLTFLHAYLGLIVWTAWRARTGRGRHSTLRRMASLHLAPVVALATLYWMDLRHVIVGGGPVVPASEIIARTLSLAVGGPEEGPLRGAVAAAALVAGLASIVIVCRSGSDLWVLFAVTSIASPILTLALLDAHLLYERYFLVSIAFLLVAFSWTLAATARRWKLVAVLLLAAFLLGNGFHTWRLVQYGRGSYIPALAYMSKRAVQRPVTVGGDHDFRQGRLLEFYRRYVPDGADIEYHEPFEWALAGPEWYLVHSQAATFQPQGVLTVEGGRRYTLATTYPFGGLSGWHLAVYHNHLAER